MPKEFVIFVGYRTDYASDNLSETEVTKADAICEFIRQVLSATQENCVEIVLPNELGELGEQEEFGSLISYVRKLALLSGWRLKLADNFLRKISFDRLP